jgi:hypothetical protein
MPNDGVVVVNRFRTVRLKEPTIDLIYADGNMYAGDDGSLLTVSAGDENMEREGIYEMDVVKGKDVGVVMENAANRDEGPDAQCAPSSPQPKQCAPRSFSNSRCFTLAMVDWPLGNGGAITVDSVSLIEQHDIGSGVRDGQRRNQRAHRISSSNSDPANNFISNNIPDHEDDLNNSRCLLHFTWRLVGDIQGLAYGTESGKGHQI